MATRKAPAQRQAGRRQAPGFDNPIQRIEFQPSDLAGVEPGGGTKQFVAVDQEYRRQLVEQLDIAASKIRDEVRASNHGLGTFVLRLRHQAIAKSHRPLTIVAESGLLHAGHERIDEMLVAAHAGSLRAFRNLVLSRDTQKIRANLSAVEHIEPWGSSRRIPAGTSALRSRGRAILRLFRYSEPEANRRVEEAVLDTLIQLGLNFSPFDKNSFGNSILTLDRLHNSDDDALSSLAELAGVRQVVPEPTASAISISIGGFGQKKEKQPDKVNHALVDIGVPAPDLPTVGVFDTGISANAKQLNAWITGTDIYILPPDTDYQHGTHVASLIAAARRLNNDHADLPKCGALVYDVCGLEAGKSNISDLVERLRTAIPKRPDVKIWNLSLGVPTPCDENSFSEFAMALDKLSDQYGVLFVVASGNYLDEPRRIWPAGELLQDRIGSPAEATRALTVGSICHLQSPPNSHNFTGEPAAYSRRGPGPVFTPKPDIVHAGGNVHFPWSAGPSSMAVMVADGTVGHSFGTSFSAPVAASMAANVWRSLQNQDQSPSPALVKALMIHAAQLVSPARSPAERRYYGAGAPLDVMDCLYDTPDSFTLLFDPSLVTGMRWRKAPYPLPASLLHEGKLRAEVIITCVYSPPLDHSAGAEYIRANVELSFGTLDEKDRIQSKVPMQGEDYTNGYEEAQVEHGGKWAPVKIHRKIFSNGVAGMNWALQARPYLRAPEAALVEPIRAYIICTLRSIDGNNSVHADGMRALATTSWARTALPLRTPIRI